MKSQESIPVLGIPINIPSREEVLRTVGEFFDTTGYHRIATVNPEFLLLAEQDAAFREALLAADLRIVDGFGIVLAGLLHGRCIARFPGADLMDAILRIANDRKLSVFLAVRADGLSTYEEVRAAILKKYPDIEILGKDIAQGNIGNWKLEIGNCAIVLCNFGIPLQETFLSSLKTQTSGLRLGMGVGGSFDYLTGKLRRAPRWMRTIGLEWLWRLILQPRRFRRIWNAVIVFPMKMILGKVKAAR